jgi:hypothetical protein
LGEWRHRTGLFQHGDQLPDAVPNGKPARSMACSRARLSSDASGPAKPSSSR